MEEKNDPLGLENKLYTIEEFGSIIRDKFGGDNYISDAVSYTHLTLPTKRIV